MKRSCGRICGLTRWRLCADNHMSAEDLKPYFDNGFLTVVRQQMLRDKATEVVRRSAQITQ